MNVGLLIGLFNSSGFPTFQSGVLRLYSRCEAHLFIDSCMLHVIDIRTVLRKQVSVFSIFVIVVYQGLKSPHLAVTCLSSQYGPSMSNNVAVSDTNVVSK